MVWIQQLLVAQPLLALFITIALGYWVGKLKIGRFVLGGIAGSLLIGVVIGQLGIKLPQGIGAIFFALFIYAVGYQGGPQFFKSLNRKTLVQLVSAVITCILGLFCVLLASWWWQLDRGTAAGLAAGGLTQSAIIGTAGDAVANLSISSHSKAILQSNIAVGYAVCYLFGSFGPILLLATIFPAMMKWDLRKEAKRLAQANAGEQSSLEANQFYALRKVMTRCYRINQKSIFNNLSLKQAQQTFNDIAIESLTRNGNNKPLNTDEKIQTNDIVAITATIEQFVNYAERIGEEILPPQSMQIIEETRHLIVNKQASDRAIKELMKDQNHWYGAFITAIYRLGEKISPSKELSVQRGDEIELVGRPQDLEKISNRIGTKLPEAKVTDFIFFGLGMALGVLIGMISFHLAGIEIVLGTGVGCLFSGLLFGWLQSRHPRYANLPQGASNFLRDFGLAIFVATIGITAGPQAIETIKQHGMQLFLLGIGVTLIPQIISFYLSYYLLKIKNPIELLACIAGGRSANPGFAALLDKAGNSTPVVPFTATYAIANILLTLWGPIIIGLVTINP